MDIGKELTVPSTRSELVANWLSRNMNSETNLTSEANSLIEDEENDQDEILSNLTSRSFSVHFREETFTVCPDVLETILGAERLTKIPLAIDSSNVSSVFSVGLISRTSTFSDKSVLSNDQLREEWDRLEEEKKDVLDIQEIYTEKRKKKRDIEKQISSLKKEKNNIETKMCTNIKEIIITGSKLTEIEKKIQDMNDIFLRILKKKNVLIESLPSELYVGKRNSLNNDEESEINSDIAKQRSSTQCSHNQENCKDFEKQLKMLEQFEQASNKCQEQSRLFRIEREKYRMLCSRLLRDLIKDAEFLQKHTHAIDSCVSKHKSISAEHMLAKTTYIGSRDKYNHHLENFKAKVENYQKSKKDPKEINTEFDKFMQETEELLAMCEIIRDLDE